MVPVTPADVTGRIHVQRRNVSGNDQRHDDLLLERQWRTATVGGPEADGSDSTVAEQVADAHDVQRIQQLVVDVERGGVAARNEAKVADGSCSSEPLTTRRCGISSKQRVRKSPKMTSAIGR